MADEKEILKQLFTRALQEFEDVKAKSKEYYEKLCNQEGKTKQITLQFKQLKQVSLLAVAEYETLHKQYVEENKYREEIGKKLEKVEAENAEIRKQNKLGSTTTILSQTENGAPPGTKGELEILRSMRDGLNEELRYTKKELTRVKSDLTTECESHSITNRRLTSTGEQMRQLNRVSSMAIGEFVTLKKKLEIESDYRHKAEEAVSELVEEHKFNVEKIRILDETNAKDEQIKGLLAKIDELHSSNEKERRETSEKIKEQEAELEVLKDATNLASLEEKLNLVLDQLEIAQKGLVEAEERASKSESEVRNLYTRLAQAEKERKDQSMAALPPPPPPPPPPPQMAGPVLRKFITKISGGKRRKQSENKEDPHQKAMMDAINNIKKGVKLRSVASPMKEGNQPTEDDDTAMGELAGLLSSLKRGTKPFVEPLDCEECDGSQSPFFTHRLKKIVKDDNINNVDSSDDENKAGPRTLVRLKKIPNLKAAANAVEDSTDNELRQKLLRQKTLADGGSSNDILKENDINTGMIFEATSEGADGNTKTVGKSEELQTNKDSESSGADQIYDKIGNNTNSGESENNKES